MESINATMPQQPRQQSNNSRLKRSLTMATAMGVTGGGLALAYDTLFKSKEFKEVPNPWAIKGKNALKNAGLLFVFSLCVDAVLALITPKRN